MKDWFLQKLVEYKVTDEKNKYKYRYGINALFILVPGTFCMIFVGGLFGELAFTFSFLLPFALVRGHYPGGHLKTKLQCFICSVGSFILLLIGKEELLKSISHVHTHAYLIIVFTLGTIMQITKLLTNNIDDKRCIKAILRISGIKVCFIIAMIFEISFLEDGILLAIILNFLLFLLKQVQLGLKEKTEKLLHN